MGDDDHHDTDDNVHGGVVCIFCVCNKKVTSLFQTKSVQKQEKTISVYKQEEMKSSSKLKVSEKEDS